MSHPSHRPVPSAPPERPPVAAAPSSVTVDVVTDERMLGQLAGDWDALLQATPDWSGFQSLAWIVACRHAIRTDAALFVLRFRAGTDTIGLLATELTARGELRSIGGAVTNYSGLLCRPERLHDVVRAFGRFLAADERVSLVDLYGLRGRSPATRALGALAVPGWSPAATVRVADCPHVDLSGGWQAAYARRRSSYRSSVSRKAAALRRLGALEFAELTDPDEARATLPALFQLFRERWRGRHESGGFADRYRSFHEHAIPALTAAGHLRLSVLRLAGEVVAFAYGISGARGTSSYVLGHANALAHQSPGQLLLVRTLEAACTRGDAEYDLSTGDEGYKRIWATGTDPLLRLVRARRQPGARARAVWRRLGTVSWAGVRSVGWLRDLRRDGLRRLVAQRTPRAPLADAPGLAAGRARVWRTYRLPSLPPDRRVVVRTWNWAEMRARLSPRLLYRAAERSFRGDRLLALTRGDRLLGVVWQARDERRPLVTGAFPADGAAPVYYHPIAADGVVPRVLLEALQATVEDEALLLVATGTFAPEDRRPQHVFRGDHGFAPVRGPRALLEMARARLESGSGS